MPESCNLLFVYGTLLGADTGKAGKSQRARLARESAFLGAASTEGRLYSLGHYPGLALPAAAGEIVHGELIELVDPRRSLAWLDAYEGIVPGEHPYNDYERVQRTVERTDGERVTAWVYVYRAVVDEAARIPGGRWLEACRDRGKV